MLYASNYSVQQKSIKAHMSLKISLWFSCGWSSSMTCCAWWRRVIFVINGCLFSAKKGTQTISHRCTCRPWFDLDIDANGSQTSLEKMGSPVPGCDSVGCHLLPSKSWSRLASKVVSGLHLHSFIVPLIRETSLDWVMGVDPLKDFPLVEGEVYSLIKQFLDE